MIRKEPYFFMIGLDYVQRLLSPEHTCQAILQMPVFIQRFAWGEHIGLGFKSSKHEHKIFFIAHRRIKTNMLHQPVRE